LAYINSTFANYLYKYGLLKKYNAEELSGLSHILMPEKQHLQKLLLLVVQFKKQVLKIIKLKGATSDFMEIERQRGISVSTSVLAFNYKDKKINILDTPDIRILPRIL
jgi:hypothetical protein